MSQQKPPQRKKRPWVLNIFLNIIALIGIIILTTPVTGVIVIIIMPLVATSGGGGVSTTPSGATSTSSPSATHVAAPARLGSNFDVQDSSGDTYGVVLTKIIDPVQATDQITPDLGRRFVAAVFTVKAISGIGPQQENAESDATLVGSDGQTYLADNIPIAGYTGFNPGEIHAAPGESTIGEVTFQMPAGVKVSKVRWSTVSSYGVRSTVQWNVP